MLFVFHVFVKYALCITNSYIAVCIVHSGLRAGGAPSFIFFIEPTNVLNQRCVHTATQGRMGS